ncbi:unnamed protein product [Rotaria sp. Silwood2]|nr:unnamed protein product [Rotaria sp. Silwood2]CAF2858670.1 unnamed protein product [Rotaria sp. Silwood2]CAF4455212.1 unnamed protein product [Rotaria sp. Silwood2]
MDITDSLLIDYHEICDQLLQGTITYSSLLENTPWEEFASIFIATRLMALRFRCQIMDSILTVSVSTSAKNLISLEPMTVQTFNTLVEMSITEIHQHNLIIANHVIDWISDMLQANQFQNQYMTSWKTEFSSLEENYILRMQPVSFMNNSCFCGSGKSNCTKTPVFYDDTGESTILPGKYPN